MFGDDVKNLSEPVNLNISDYSNEPTEPNSLAVVWRVRNERHCARAPAGERGVCTYTHFVCKTNLVNQ